MSATCPAGHLSAAEDYCDVCGMPIEAAAPPPGGTTRPAAASAPTGPPVLAPTDAPMAVQACPHCSAPNAPDALFCEACGYDFTTGSMPRPLAPPDSAAAAAPFPASSGPADSGSTAPAAEQLSQPATAQPGGEFAWVVELWVDPAWYRAQESPDPLPSAGLPVVRPLLGRSLLVGRTSRSRNIHPDVDCLTDSGVSRRQSQLTTDGTRWWVEDLDSANGTFVGPATGALPTEPIPVGVRHELGPDDRIYVGAWTRLVIRAATDDERATLS
ncbi:MAG: FHA domain-containing protein [Friedmanniella sp.]